MDEPQRKPNRLPCFDYSTPGAYFVTICTQNRQCILADIVTVGDDALNIPPFSVGATIGRPPMLVLSPHGKIVENAIHNISHCYPMVSVDHYVIMPNHVHLLLQIRTGPTGRPMVAPTISRVIQQMKGAVSKEIGHSMWQKSYHDHVIRNERDYQRIWNYIDGNPARWREDCFYTEDIRDVEGAVPYECEE